MQVSRSLSPVVALAVVAVAATAAATAAPAPWKQDLLAVREAVPVAHPSELVPRSTDFAAVIAQSQEAEANPAAFEKPYRGPRRWWAVLSSAVVPGMGQAMTGHFVWGGAQIFADAAMILGAVDRDQEGKDKETQYKEFADQHYSEDAWTRALANGDLEPFFGHGVGSKPENVPLYVPKEEDEREWYENIGKWDQFAWGWREYWDDDWPWPENDLYRPGDSPPFDPNDIFETPLRAEYVALRGESNDAFNARDRFINVSILLRFFSVVQMAYFEGFIGGGRFENDARRPAPADAPPRFGWFMAPAGAEETRMGVKVSY